MPDLKTDLLFHYTTARGLSGILSTSCLRAYSPRFSNDLAEYEFARSALQSRIAQKMKENAPNWNFLEGAEEEIKQKFGGLDNLVEIETARAIDISYNTTSKYFHPFTISFCKHNSDAEIRHGLLSQWRAYGDDSAYAIALNHNVLSGMLTPLSEREYFNYWRLDEVSYTNPEILPEKFYEKADKFYDAIEHIIHGVAEEDLDGGAIFDAQFSAACFLKHHAFSEEREWRAAFAPNESGEPPPDGKARDRVRFRHDVKNGMLVPYIEAFTGPELIKAVSHIIVGPHADSKRRAESLRVSLRHLNIDVEVMESDIPYFHK